MNRFLLLAFVGLFTNTVLAQYQQPFGNVTVQELEIDGFPGDPEAEAVALFEYGVYTFEVKGGYVYLMKEYHTKIKILTEEGLEMATREIPLFKTDKAKEEIIEFRGITHNERVKSGIEKSAQFEVDESTNWSAYRFTFPNVKVGSIIEYKYKLQSPFFHNLDRWDFQGKIPKLLSRFHAEIPGNYVYNRVLKGDLPLTLNRNSVMRNCFSIPSSKQPASCEVLDYAIENVPAFREPEPYMLSPENYISRLKFEMAEYFKFGGGSEKYAKTWADVDREFKKDQDIGRQVKKTGFFADRIPAEFKQEADPLKKAQGIYKHIRDHFTWNRKYGIYRKVRVKEAYEKGLGSIGEINISLLNMLNAADIPSKMVLISTREKGLPGKLQASIYDFNYLIVLANINGKEVFLDASDKFTAFGTLPFRALNYEGRVMDFKNDSYWVDLPIPKVSKGSSQVMLQFDLENELIKGRHRETRTGYIAADRYRRLKKLSEDSFLMEIENQSEVEITSHKINKNSNENVITQTYAFELPGFGEDKRIRFNAFFVRFLNSSPFKKENRLFPVDFGFPRNYSYNLIVPIPEGYKAGTIPEAVNKTMGQGRGTLLFDCKLSPDAKSINLQCSFNVRDSYFKVAEYSELKALYDTFFQLQENSLITLEKI